MQKPLTIAIVGATSAIATHCIRLWATQAPHEFIFIGRDQQKLKTLADDIRVRNPNAAISTINFDLLSCEAINLEISNLCKDKTIDIVLIAHGYLSDQLDCQNHLATCERSLKINGLSPVLFAEAFAHFLEIQKRGTLAIISSVAGDRARKSNYTYGAAKAFVSSYTEGLQHRFYKSPIKVILIKPGPTLTPMTENVAKPGLSFAPVELVAQEIVEGINRSTPIIYTPKKWAIIMFVVKHLPKFIFQKLNL